MNVEKLRRLQSQVRIGGKGTARRKKKVMHQTATTDDKKLQSSLKKLSVSTIPGIEEVNIIKDDLTVIHFNNPKAQASLSANTFAVTGHGETKKIVEMLPEILPQLGQETVVQLRMFANSMAGTKKPAGTMGGGDATASTNMLYSVVEEDDVPMLVSDFDEVAKTEAMKVGEAITTNNEQPAIECEQTQKNEKSDEVKGETAAVLPPLTEVKSNEMGNAVQPLEILNLNIKSSVDPEPQKENENIIKKQEVIPEKENINKTEKQNLKNDAGKTKEKSQQKQEPLKQKVKSESKPQKSSKDSKKPDDIAPKASTIKAGENREVEAPAKDSVVKDIADIELEKSEQVTKISTNLKENRDHLQKQIQQKQPQKSTKQEPKKKEKPQGPLVDNQKKNTEQDLSTQQKEGITETEDKKIKKRDELQQTKTIPDPIEGDGQQVKIEPNQQQQQNNESSIKQKNKQLQKKQQNEDNQNKPDAGKEFKSSEPVPNSAKQDNKQQIIKTAKEGSADKSVEIKKNNEAQSQDIKRHLKEASPNLKKADTQTKSSKQAKEVLIDKIDAKKGTTESLPKSTKQGDENIQKLDSVAKENEEGIALKGQSEEVGKQKEENVHIENTNKDNVSTIESGQKVETDKSSENVSIKTIALQSLESSEKMMQIVDEITKDLMKENLNKLPEETIKHSPRPNLPSDQQEVTEMAVKSLLTEELLPKSSVEEIQLTKVNTDNQKSSGPLSETSTEIIQDLATNTELLNIESDAKSVIIKDQLPSVASEIVADISLSMDTIPLKVSENNDKNMALEKEISQEQMLPSQDVSTIESNPSGEQLAKQSLPPTIPSSTAQISANNNNDKSIVVDPAHKQPTMAEILQSQPPTMPPATVLPLSNNPLVGEMKDIQIKVLNKEDVKELQLYSTVAVDGANLCQPQDQEVITPDLSTPSTDDISDQRQITTEKSAPMPISPKQKASPPKQTTNAKTSNETTKQHTKPSTTGDSQKATGDAKLKLVTKPQIGQQPQQQQTSKVKSKPTNSNKSTPTTPTTPTKMSPEKGTTDKQKPQISATKVASDTATKKANSPQKQQQIDTSGKAKSTSGASGKSARPNISTTSGSAKKANTPPATNKTNANTGVKQADISKKGTAPGITTVAEPPTALAETKSAPTTGTTTTTPSTTSPSIESTATSNKPYPSK